MQQIAVAATTEKEISSPVKYCNRGRDCLEIWGFVFIMEIWRDIPGYVGIYQVSNYGNVKRLAGYNGKYFQSEHELKKTIGKNGYLHITLTKDSECKCFAVHKIVAKVFIPNPDEYNCVNHINEIKTDNRPENLEWCDHYYNNHYGTAETKNNKPIIGKSLIDGTERIFDSIKSASEELNLNASNIGSCCKGLRKSVGGYKWEFAL